ncbi:MAG: DUF6098 family protein [Mycobacteriales bacterium]
MAMPELDRLDELVRLVQDRPGLFLRYSNGPDADADETSRDYESGLELPGLPATVLDPPPWWRRPVADWLARQVCKYAHLAGDGDRRRAWVLGGRVAGQGPDHEPLIRGAEPVAWLSTGLVDEARKRYEDRFDVGEDST